MIFVFLFLTSLFVTNSRFIHLSSNDSRLFLFRIQVPQLLDVFICQWIGCFYVLAIISDAAVNIGVHVSFWIKFSHGYMTSGGIVGSYGSFLPSFLSTVLHSVFDSEFWKKDYTFSLTCSLEVLYGLNQENCY